MDELDIWSRTAESVSDHPESRWRGLGDPVVRFVCPIDQGHIQAAPVNGWPSPLDGLVDAERMRLAINEVFPDGAYVDHVTMSLARPGSAGVELHGGGFEQDARQYYRSDRLGWSAGLTIFALALTPTVGRQGGTALVPGSHKASIPPSGSLPDPEEFRSHDWITGVTLAAGDLLVFTEAMMHGAYPWVQEWERRYLIAKVYPNHLANLHANMRHPDEPFWVSR